jgi:hypothetical protein
MDAPRLEVVPALDALPRAVWEELAPPDDPMWAYGLFRAMETGGVGPDGFEYLVFRDPASGHATAILPAFWFRALPLHSTLEEPWRRRIDAVQRRVPGFLSIGAYFAGHPLGRGRLLGGPGGSPAGEQILAAVRERARAHGLRWAILKDFPAGSPAFAAPGEPGGGGGFFPIKSLPEAVLALPEGTFDDYLAGLRLKARRNLRSKARRFAASGLRIERGEDFAPLVPAMVDLYETVMRTARVRFDHATPAFFAALADPAPGGLAGVDRRLAVTAWDGGRLAGFLLCLFAGRGGVCLRVGFDAAAARTRDSRLYFALHYEAIRAALEHGCRELNFCQTSYPPKLEMGCGLVPLSHLATHTSRLLLPLIRRAMPGLIESQQRPFQPETGMGGWHAAEG